MDTLLLVRKYDNIKKGPSDEISSLGTAGKRDGLLRAPSVFATNTVPYSANSVLTRQIPIVLSLSASHFFSPACLRYWDTVLELLSLLTCGRPYQVQKR